jgi:hypothetical protein
MNRFPRCFRDKFDMKRLLSICTEWGTVLFGLRNDYIMFSTLVALGVSGVVTVDSDSRLFGKHQTNLGLETTRAGAPEI